MVFRRFSGHSCVSVELDKFQKADLEKGWHTFANPPQNNPAQASVFTVLVSNLSLSKAVQRI